eukprot:3663349-Alexandrium_andersonii.AAC.1
MEGSRCGRPAGRCRVLAKSCPTWDRRHGGVFSLRESELAWQDGRRGHWARVRTSECFLALPETEFM